MFKSLSVTQLRSNKNRIFQASAQV